MSRFLAFIETLGQYACRCNFKRGNPMEKTSSNLTQVLAGNVMPDFAKRGGLIVAIAQDYLTKEILMQAWTNEACHRETVATGEVVYFSTSKQERWKKGETSGHIQKVMSMRIDCDLDCIIYFVEQVGGACHTHARSCFFRDVIGGHLTMDVPKPEDATDADVVQIETHIDIARRSARQA